MSLRNSREATGAGPSVAAIKPHSTCHQASGAQSPFLPSRVTSLGRRFGNSRPSRTDEGLFLSTGSYALGGEDVRTPRRHGFVDKQTEPC